MTKITIKQTKQHDAKIIEGFCNGKNYAGTMYVNRPTGGYIKVNGSEIDSKTKEVYVDEIVSIESEAGLPMTVSAWMKLMEKVG